MDERWRSDAALRRREAEKRAHASRLTGVNSKAKFKRPLTGTAVFRLQQDAIRCFAPRTPRSVQVEEAGGHPASPAQDDLVTRAQELFAAGAEDDGGERGGDVAPSGLAAGAVAGLDEWVEGDFFTIQEGNRPMAAVAAAAAQ